MSIYTSSIRCAPLLLLLLQIGCAGVSNAEYEVTVRERQALSPEAARLVASLNEAVGQGAFGLALALADSAAVLAPELADVPFQRSMALMTLGRYDEAETALRKVLALDPNYPAAWYELGNLAFRRQQYEEAIGFYQREEQVLLALQKRQVAGVSFDPGGIPAARLQMGRSARQLNDTAGARAYLEDALRADSSNASVYVELSQMYEEGGNLERALAFARQAHQRDPGSPDVVYTLGSLLFQTGAVDEAIPHLEHAVAMRPWFYGALYNLGQALVRAGRTDEAQQYLKAAEDMQVLETQINQARLDAAQHPAQTAGWLDLAGLLVSAGRYDEAEHSFRIALNLEPDNLNIRNDLANLFLVRGNEAAAVRQFQAILAQDSTFADAWLNLGVVYALSGDAGAAEQAWQRTLQYSPGHPEAQANLARLATLRQQ